VHGVLTDADQAVIIGELSSRVKATGKVIDTSFALILTIAGGRDHTISDARRQLCDIGRCPCQRFIGTGHSRLFAPEQPATR
jgi:hypothetical protein